MLTMKKLNEKISNIEKLLIKPTNVTFIARKILYKDTKDYEQEKENLIRRGFELTKVETEKPILLYIGYKNKEIWEKEYANGEF